MHFQLVTLNKDDEAVAWHWFLATADESILAKAPKPVDTEREARAQIAAFRKAAGGVKFAKVLKP